MCAKFDKWTLLKVFEVGFTIACIVCKRVTDDEASRLFLYLQKLSREWSLLNNVTWDQIGSAVADATYGGYIIITSALLIGRITGELPTEKRITEMVLLGIGVFLFVIIGSLEFASLDSVPPDLVDNAAVIGSLTLTTAFLFLIDLGGPKAKKSTTESQTSPRTPKKATESSSQTQQIYDIEQAFERSERKNLDSFEKPLDGRWKIPIKTKQNGFRGNQSVSSRGGREQQKPRRFDIYGKDAIDFGNESETDEIDDIPPKMAPHSPVWAKIRHGNGQYGKYDIVTPTYLYPHPKTDDDDRPPSTPGDPGYVQYTAQRWGQPIQKTPKSSPTQI